MDKQIIVYEEKKTDTTYHLWVPLHFWFTEPYSYHFPYMSVPKIKIPKEIVIKTKLCDQKDIKKI